MRVVDTRHARCGTRTRVRIPATLPSRVVRSVHCPSCAERFDADAVSEVAGGGGGWFSLARLREAVALHDFDPSSRAWQLASIAVAAVLVIGGLFLIQGDGDGDVPTGLAAPAAERPVNPQTPAGLPGEPVQAGRGVGDLKGAAEVVRGSSFSLALPSGWDKVDPPAGATFAAVADNGEADATLWIEEDAKLDFPAFVTQSLAQMKTLSPNPEVCERTPGPTPETTVVRLCAQTPPGQPSYEVVLRAAGPYRYYLALTVQPDATRKAADGIDLLANSMTPEVRG